MVATLTYSSLIEKLTAYAERISDPSLNDQLPFFVTLAEYRVSQEVKILPAVQFVASNFQAGTSVYEKPGRLRDFEFVNFSAGAAGFETTAPFNRRINLLRRTYDFCRNYWPDPTVQGVPVYYADYGMANMLIVPTPNAAYPFELGYYERAIPLSDSNQTNWMTSYAPNLLLFACLWEMQTFLKNFDMAKSWEDQYNRAARALMNEDVLQTTDAQSSQTAEGS